MRNGTHFKELNPVVALNSAHGFTPLEIMPRSVSSRNDCLPAGRQGISNGVYPTLTQRGMAVKSMSSPGSIQELPLGVILPPGHEALWAGGKRVETAF